MAQGLPRGIGRDFNALLGKVSNRPFSPRGLKDHIAAKRVSGLLCIRPRDWYPLARVFIMETTHEVLLARNPATGAGHQRLCLAQVRTPENQREITQNPEVMRP